MLLQIRSYRTYLLLQQVTPAPPICPVIMSLIGVEVQDSIYSTDDLSSKISQFEVKCHQQAAVMLLGQPARLALLQRLLPILGSMRGLQRATVQAGSVEFMQKVAALSRAQVVRIAKVPSARSATFLTNWRALE